MLSLKKRSDKRLNIGDRLDNLIQLIENKENPSKQLIKVICFLDLSIKLLISHHSKEKTLRNCIDLKCKIGNIITNNTLITDEIIVNLKKVSSKLRFINITFNKK